MNRDEQTARQYDRRYADSEHYWRTTPSSTCCQVLQLLPPDRPRRLLDLGCGEGRNALFFARNGYDVEACDISPEAVAKTAAAAEQLGLPITVFEANINTFRLTRSYDILFASGVLHCVPQEQRAELFQHYKASTTNGGLNVLNVFIRKPFIEPPPDQDANSQPWISGELFTYYHDWLIEHCTEVIFDCNSGGQPHQHAVNQMIARKPSG